MITEDQARALLAGEPARTLDADAVLRSARRSVRRRRAAVATAAAVAVAGPVVAVAARDTTAPASLTPARPPASPSAPAALPRGYVVVGTFVDAQGQRREVVAYFSDGDRRPGGTRWVCTGIARDGVVDDSGGCHAPALPEPGRHIGAAGGNPGETEDGARSKPGVLGAGWSITVVSNDVHSGGVYDERGRLREGRVLGIGDPNLPGRFLVVEDIGEYLTGLLVRDAAGRVLEQRSPWLRAPYATPSR